MIVTLVREQLRAQRRFVWWTGALLTMTMSLAATALVGAATQLATDDLSAEAFWPAGEHQAWVQWWTTGEPVDTELDTSVDDMTDVLAPGELEAMVDAARAEGAEVTAQSWLTPWLEPADGSIDGLGDVVPITQYPAPDWEEVVIEGEAPARGQIVLAADIAETRNVAVGDTVTLVEAYPAGPEFRVDVEVSGLSAPTVLGPLVAVAPTSYALWADGITYANASDTGVLTNASGTPTRQRSATVVWSGEPRALAPLEPIAAEQAVEFEDGTMVARLGVLDGWTVAVLVAAGITALAALGAALAIGRSQGQARLEWIATARVLGARRSTIVAASAAEAVVIGAVSTALGTVVGWLVVAGLLTSERSAHPGVHLPSAPSLTLLGASALMVAGVTLAVAMAVFPAFWASRVPPAAALKPVTPLAEEPLSREVSARWLVLATLALMVAVGWGAASGAFDLPGVGGMLSACAWIALGVLIVMDIVEIARRANAGGYRLLSRSAHPWAVSCASASGAQRRAGGAAASVVALAIFGAVGLVGFVVMNASTGISRWPEAGTAEVWTPLRDTGLPTLHGAGLVLGATVLATTVAAAIVRTARRSGAGDDALRGSLGLTRADARKAAAVEMAVPLVAGVLSGAVVGWLIGSLAGIVLTSDPARTGAELLALAGMAALAGLWVCALALVPVVAASAVAAATVRTVSPVEAARVR